MSGVEDDLFTVAWQIGKLAAGTEDASKAEAMAALNRIAAQMPQRATRPDGRPLWVRRGHVCADDVCTSEQMTANGWRPLYVLGEAS